MKLTNLSLSKALKFRIATDGKLYASLCASSGEFYLAPEVLSLLCAIQAFAKDSDLPKLIKILHSSYAKISKTLPDLSECTAIIQDLVAAGVLLDNTKDTHRSLQNDGFANVWIQWAMLCDTQRVAAYKRAIYEKINPNSIVVDVGAGSGLLTAACLEAGAKHVIAVEETQIAEKIKDILTLCQLPTNSSRLTILNKNSFDVTLPNKITHIVSELFGNDPLQEGVIATLRNIGQNFTIQPQYIPLKIAIYFECIDLLDHPIKQRIISTRSNILCDNFLSAAKKIFNLDNISLAISLAKNNFRRVSKVIKLGELALNPPPIYAKNKHPLCGAKKIKYDNSGNCIVGLMWFRIYLTNSITLSSHPYETDAAQHWSQIVHILNTSALKNKEFILNYSLNSEENQVELSVN